MKLRPSLMLCLILCAAQARGAALIGGLGGPGPNGGYGTGGPLMANDDQSSASIDITPAFPSGVNFFGKTYNSMYVNTNGNITFNASLSTYTPAAFPIASQPMIAPFWGDVDTRGNGMPATNGIWWFVEPGRLIVTWSQVGYYNTHDDLKNDFQLILTTSTCGSSDFDVEFRYNQCQWTTGDASQGSHGLGGIPAQAGFDAGDSTNFVTVPGSRTADIIKLCTTSNVGINGVWRFQIRNGAIAGGCAGGGTSCDTGQMGACAAGINQCSGAGVVCNAVVASEPERCDGVDNDCNGMVDETMGLCPTNQVCDRGMCVDACIFELGCPNAGDVCTDRGSCVEPSCAMVDCPPGQRCKGGSCYQPCDGVTCPYQQVCRVGRCVDPCAGVTCGMNKVCMDGSCVPTCQCQPCVMGFTCQADGKCISALCTSTTCPAGQHCSGGGCLDDCALATCPDGQACMSGQCVDLPPMDMTVVQDLAGVPDLSPMANLAPDGGAGPPTATTSERNHAGCDVAAGPSSGFAWLFFFGLALLARRRLKLTSQE